MVKYVLEYENSELSFDFLDPTGVGSYEFNVNSLMEGEESFRPLSFIFKLKEEQLDYSKDIQEFYNKIYDNLSISSLSNIKIIYVSNEGKEYEIFNVKNYTKYDLINNLKNVIYINRYSEVSSDYILLHRIAFELKH